MQSVKYLMDTHILIWLAISPDKVSKEILSVVEDPKNELFISTVSLWEIAIKISIGKLCLNGLDIPQIIDFCRLHNIQIAQLSESATIEYARLPKKENHKDPFDRILISICIASGWTFLSADTNIEQYKNNGLAFIS